MNYGGDERMTYRRPLVEVEEVEKPSFDEVV